MAYTHDFEIKINGVVLEGELDFSLGKYKSTTLEEMTVKQHGIVQQLLELFIRTYSTCDDTIDKIEIVDKNYVE